MQVIAKYDMQDSSGPESVPRAAHGENGDGLHRVCVACSMQEQHQGVCSQPSSLAFDPWAQH